LKKLLLLLFVSTSLFAQASTWNQRYKLVLKDIKTIRALKRVDLEISLRLFELYGEMLTLLIEKENDIRIKFDHDVAEKKLVKVNKLKRKTLGKVTSVAEIIKKRSRDNEILARVYYYQALNYQLLNKKKEFYRYLKIAEKKNPDKEFAYYIYSKLADYHYNEQQFTPAIKYYNLAIPYKSKWQTKYRYNLGWCYLKTDKTKLAVDELKLAKENEKKPEYFKLGQQLDEGLLFFFAFTKRTAEGLKYFYDVDIVNFKNMMLYLDYVFEHGRKKDIALVFQTITDLKKTVDQEVKFVVRKLQIYRSKNAYKSIQITLAKFNKEYDDEELKTLAKEPREEIVNLMLSYTGFVQEYLKKSGGRKSAKKDRYLGYVLFNFDLLARFKPENHFLYTFYQGETLLSVKRYQDSLTKYRAAINMIDLAKPAKETKAIFDSSFLALSRLSKPKDDDLIFTYEKFLAFYPVEKRAPQIYAKTIGFFLSKKEGDKALAYTSTYNKHYPAKVKEQQDYYRLIINEYIDAKNIASIEALSERVKVGYLGFKQKEYNDLLVIIRNLYFETYEEMARNNKLDEAIEGFLGLYSEKEYPNHVRHMALIKAMEIQFKAKDFQGLHQSLVNSLVFFNSSQMVKFKTQYHLYLRELCLGLYDKGCFDLEEKYNEKKEVGTTNDLKRFALRLRILFGYPLESLYKNYTTIAMRKSIFRALLFENPDFSASLYASFYRDQDKAPIIDQGVDHHFYLLFYRTLSIDETLDWVNSLAVKTLVKKYEFILKDLKEILAQLKFHLPPKEVKDIYTQLTFSKYGEKFQNSIQNKLGYYNEILSKSDNPLKPYIISRMIMALEQVQAELKLVEFKSENAELKTAMDEAIGQFMGFLNSQEMEFRKVYQQLLLTLDGPISGKQYFDNYMTAPRKTGLSEVDLWL
jgi:hypothetical protein